jgi:hypothetical protein
MRITPMMPYVRFAGKPPQPEQPDPDEPRLLNTSESLNETGMPPEDPPPPPPKTSRPATSPNTTSESLNETGGG